MEYKLKIIQDEYPENLRSLSFTDCNLGVMVCFHSRYNLGDEHNYKQEDFNSWVLRSER